MLRSGPARGGGVGAIALVLALVAIAAAGFVVLYQNDYVKVEAAISNPDVSKDPMTAVVKVRVTNLYTAPLVIERFDMTIWADPAQTLTLSSASAAGIVVPPGQTVTIELPVEIHNADAFTGKVWVDVESTWAHGEQHYSESIDGKEISVGSALASLS
jgi:hypothetical protein